MGEEMDPIGGDADFREMEESSVRRVNQNRTGHLRGDEFSVCEELRTPPASHSVGT